jgi:hypothetical protein
MASPGESIAFARRRRSVDKRTVKAATDQSTSSAAKRVLAFRRRFLVLQATAAAAFAFFTRFTGFRVWCSVFATCGGFTITSTKAFWAST